MAVVTSVRVKNHPRIIQEITVDPPECPANDTVEFTASVPLSKTDMYFLPPRVDLPDGLGWAEPPRCATNGTVTFKLLNATGSPVNMGSTTMVVIAI